MSVAAAGCELRVYKCRPDRMSEKSEAINQQ